MTFQPSGEISPRIIIRSVPAAAQQEQEQRQESRRRPLPRHSRKRSSLGSSLSSLVTIIALSSIAMASVLRLSMRRVEAFSILRVQHRPTIQRSKYVAPGVSAPLPRGDDSSNKNGSIRLYSFNRFNDEKRSNNNDVDDDDVNKSTGFLSRLKDKAKQYLPFLRTDKEKQVAIERKRVKTELQSSIQQVLRDAPLPIRAIGGLVGSLLGSAMSELAQAASQQSDLVDRYYGRAAEALTANASVQSAVGSPVQVGPITSQSSSTTSINGRSSTRLQLGFAVYGRDGSGQAQLSVQTTNNDNTDPPPTLRLQLNTGQILTVPMDGRKQSTSSYADQRFSFSTTKWNNSHDDDSVIEAEIIEKKPSQRR